MAGNDEKERTKKAAVRRQLSLFVVRLGSRCRGRWTTRIFLCVLLECEQLLRTEGLVVDVRSRLDEVLQVGPIYFKKFSQGNPRAHKEIDRPGQEVPEVNELAVALVFDIDDTPAVLAPTDSLPIDDHITFRANHCKRDHVLIESNVPGISKV